MIKNIIENWVEAKRALVDLENQFKKEDAAYAEAHRTISNGTVVEVWDGLKKKKLGEGIVMSCRTSLFLDDLYVDELEEGTGIDKRLNDIRYEVFAMKKDGTPSTKHFFQIPHFISADSTREGEYIKVK